MVCGTVDVYVVRGGGGGVVCSDSRDLIDPQHYSGPAPSQPSALPELQ